MWCAVDIKSQLYVTHNVQKYFQIRTLMKRLLTKYKIFTKLPQIYIFTKIVILKV